MSGCQVCGWEDYEPICPTCVRDLPRTPATLPDEDILTGDYYVVLLKNGVPAAITDPTPPPA